MGASASSATRDRRFSEEGAMEEREITIVKGGRQTPFSRGILAQTLALAGAGPELAHHLAS